MMDAARPLGVGQLLDRAVASYARTFLPLFLIVGAVAVPLALVLAWQHDPSRMFADFMRLAADRSNDPAVRAQIFHEMQRDRTTGGTYFTASLLGALCSLLSTTAAYVFADAYIAGTTLTIAAAYRVAVTRWFPVLIVTVVGSVLAGIALLIALIPFLIAGLLLGAVLGFVLGKAAAIGWAIIFLVVCLVGIVLAIFVNVMIAVARADVAIGAAGPLSAISAALRATFDRRYWRSTLVVGAAIFAIGWFSLLLNAAIGVTIVAVHAPVFAQLASTLVAIAVEGVLAFVVLLYAHDVRNRRSGDDLLRLAEEMPLGA